MIKISRKARLHNQFGVLLTKSKLFKKAIHHFRSAVSIEPNYSDAHCNLANALVTLSSSMTREDVESDSRSKTQLLRDAQHHYIRAIHIQPSNLKVFAQLGYLLMKTEKLLPALSCLFTAVSDSKTGTSSFLRESHYNIATVLRLLGRHDEAIHHSISVIQKSMGNRLFQPPERCHNNNSKASTRESLKSLDNDLSVTVVCVKWGTKYDAKYVNKLYRGVKLNMERDFKFLCFTDDKKGLDESIGVHKLEEGWETWWTKVSLFAPTSGLAGTVLYIDLDTIITGSLEPLFRYDIEFGTLSTKGFANEGREVGFNSSIIVWNADRFQPVIYTVAKKYYAHIRNAIHRFDHWLEIMLPNATLLQNVCYEGMIVEYTASCTTSVPSNASIVNFPLQPKPHEYPSDWIRKIWI